MILVVVGLGEVVGIVVFVGGIQCVEATISHVPIKDLKGFVFLAALWLRELL